MQELAAGSRWSSAVCETEVIVVRPPDQKIALQCGGHDMVPAGAARRRATLDPDFAVGSRIGKRYADPASGLEILVVSGGPGSLAVDGKILEEKAAKPLPSSD